VNPDVGIGVDVGTGGVRAVALASAGQMLASASTPLPPSRRPGAGLSEQDPELWWDALVEVLNALSNRVDLKPRRCALCLDATSASVLLADPLGRPITPALMYDDRRAIRAAETIAECAPADAPARGAGSSLAKALHLLSECAPSAAPGPARRRAAPTGSLEGETLILHQADWLTGRLLGSFGDTDWNNALKLGFDIRALGWPAWIAATGVPPSSLPRVHAPGSPLGTIDAQIAEATGLPPYTVIRAGTTDSTAAVIAAGARAPGDAVTSLGSTLVLKVLSPRPVEAARYGVYSHRFGDAWLVGGASNSGGKVLKGFFDDAALRRLSAEIDPGQDSGLEYYPLSEAGERFPVYDPSLQPRLTPRPASDARFLHGLLEGIARIERDGYRLLHSLGAPSPHRVLTCGGGASNDTWTRLRRRLLGVEVAPAQSPDAAVGVARLALRDPASGSGEQPIRRWC
jgi:sugar (pentulose or hexulose) kinase